MKRFLKAVVEIFALMIGADCDTRRRAAFDNVCDFSGQGRNKYGW